MNDETSATGERLETFIYNDNTFEHLHRYSLASSYVEKKVVLDIASGEGYGSKLLSNHAQFVIGVDIDSETVQNAIKKYSSSRLIFRVGSADFIPVDDKSIDVVVSFETLEHHDKHHEMMNEIKRVLKPGGILILSTPDKKFYSDEKGYKNPFHIKELYEAELKSLINSNFKFTYYYYQNMVRGSLIIPENKNSILTFFNGDYASIKYHNEIKPLYLIVMASDCEFQRPGSSIFTSSNLEEIEKEKREKEEENLNVLRIENAINLVRNSLSYKVGNFLLRPFSFLRNKYL
jgi:ubiquinone/menaquinone biosynthesis C-methylase UbiE